MGIARRGGFNPCQNVCGALCLRSSIFGQNGFVLLDSLKGVFNLGKKAKGGGVWPCQNFWSSLGGNFDYK